MLSWHKYLSLSCILVSFNSVRGTGTEYEVLRIDENCKRVEKTMHKTDMSISYFIQLFDQNQDVNCVFTIKIPWYWLWLREHYGFHVYLESIELLSGDYIQFGTSFRYSGNYSTFGNSWTNRSYFEMKDAVLELRIVLRSTTRYQPKRKLDLTITFLKKNCWATEGIWINCPGHDFCIHKGYFGDGYHNCPQG